MADGLWKNIIPRLVVDVAVVSLGQRYTGLFTSIVSWRHLFRKLGEETGDQVWPLPLSSDL